MGKMHVNIGYLVLYREKMMQIDIKVMMLCDKFRENFIGFPDSII